MNKAFFFNVFKVVFSNGLMLLSSIVVAFVLPKIMPIEEYGTYKEFTLYFSYAGILHLGFVDAIFIKYSAIKAKDVDKKEIRIYSFFFLLMQIALFILFLIASIFIPASYRFFIIALAYGFFTANLTTYFQYFSQAIERFNELAIRNIIKAIITSLVVVVLWLLHSKGVLDIVSAKIYILCFLMTNTLLTLWYMFTYRKYLFTSLAAIRSNFKDIKKLFIIGFPVMLAASVSNLILISDRQFAVFFSSKEQYAVYAFAYNIATLIITLVSAVSIVFFPSLKKTNSSAQAKNYPKSLLYISIISFSFGCFFLPVKIFIDHFLPKYSLSADYIFILMPAIFMNIVIATININYYKALSMNKRYLIVSIMVLVFAIVSNGLFYLFTKSLEGLSIASVVTFSLWLLISTNDMRFRLRNDSVFPLVYIIIMTLSFYSAKIIGNQIISCVVYCAAWILVSAAFILFVNRFRKKEDVSAYFARGY